MVWSQTESEIGLEYKFPPIRVTGACLIHLQYISENTNDTRIQTSWYNTQWLRGIFFCDTVTGSHVRQAQLSDRDEDLTALWWSSAIIIWVSHGCLPPSVHTAGDSVPCSLVFLNGWGEFFKYIHSSLFTKERKMSIALKTSVKLLMTDECHVWVPGSRL